MPSVSLNTPDHSPASPSVDVLSSMGSPSSPLRSPPIPTLTIRHPSSTSSTAVGTPHRTTSPISATTKSPVSAGSMSTSPSTFFSPTSPSSSFRSEGLGLLVPTDRAADDLEENWLPRLGKFRIEREVRVPGYALYGIRSWYLSRQHWSFTIATSTGKPTDQISCYVLVPSPELSDSAAAALLSSATRRLAHETHGTPRNTEFGTLLVSAPSGYRQEISPIQTGDMREAWPYIVLNTALRRLGCGGRAALGNEVPVPAVQRKFYDLYRITMPKGSEEAGGPGSPPSSPTHTNKSYDHLGQGHPLASSTTSAPGGQLTAETVANSPILLNVVELVKIIQAALAIWGMYGADSDEIEMDGLFCDDTKKGLFEWRRVMGMESDDGFKLVKETSGGCIDPRTLAALVSSITSVRYQLAAMGVEKLPKDPFSSPRKFLQVWRAYQAQLGNKTSYLSVAGIRALNSGYIAGRSKTHAADALKVHRFLLSGVASATSTISANLKGGSNDDSATPLRKREQHKHFGGDADDASGVGMIVPETNTNATAAPDVITTDLVAYRKLLEKSREKDWDTMGARRVAELWSGLTAERGPERDGGRHHGRLQAFRRRVTQNSANNDDDDNSTAMGTFKGMRDRTGAAIKGGFGLVGRRHPTLSYDTSDSEGPSRSRRRHQTVPVLVEPEATDDRGTASAQVSRSPSPSPSGMPIPPTPTVRTQLSTYPSIQSPLQRSIRLSTSNLSAEYSDGSLRGPTSPMDRRRSLALSAASTDLNTSRGLPNPSAPKMLRMRSDPPEVILDGSIPTVRTKRARRAPTGAASMNPEQVSDLNPKQQCATLSRSKSFTHADEYRDLRRKIALPLDEHVTNLSIDVDMCGVVWELRKKERQLAKRAADMQTLERSAMTASQAIFDARDSRLAHLAELEREAAQLVDQLKVAGATGFEDDENLHRAANNVQFYLSEDTNTNELVWGLQDLQKAWESIRDEPKTIDVVEMPKTRKWWHW